VKLSRRSSLLSAVVVPIVGLVPAAESVAWIALMHEGVDVLERQPVAFQWDAELRLTFSTDRTIQITGVGLYEEPTGGEPLRESFFDLLQMSPADKLDVTWVFRKV